MFVREVVWLDCASDWDSNKLVDTDELKIRVSLVIDSEPTDGDWLWVSKTV